MSNALPKPTGAELLARVPRPPRIPSERARELVFRYHGSQKVLLIVGSIFLAVGSVTSVVFCWGLPADVALSIAGREVTGIVTDTRIQENIYINGRHPTLVRYRFSLEGEPEGEGGAGAGVYEAESITIDPETIAAARPGARVAVEVAPWNPRWVRLKGGTYSLFGYYGAPALIFPAVGATLAGFAIRANRREIRAFTHGEATLARVTFRGLDAMTRLNSQHPYKVGWEFKVGERIYSGSISHMNLLAIEDLMERSETPVLYDPANLKVNTVYVE